MILRDLRTFCREIIPGLKERTVSDSTLNNMIYQAVVKISLIGRLFHKIGLMNITADQSNYDLISSFTDFLTPSENYIKWLNNSSQWVRLHVKTRKYWDNNHPYWLNDSSSDPREYIIEDTTLILRPAPDTTQSNGLHIPYYYRPSQVTDDSHYPFGGSSKHPVYDDILDFAILHYVKWKLAQVIGDEQKSGKSYQEFIEELNFNIADIKQRPDIITDDETRMLSVPIIE